MDCSEQLAMKLAQMRKVMTDLPVNDFNVIQKSTFLDLSVTRPIITVLPKYAHAGVIYGQNLVCVSRVIG